MSPKSPENCTVGSWAARAAVCRSREVLAVLQRLRKRSCGIEVVQRGVGLRVGEAISLVERQPDGARQRQLVLGQLVGCGDKRLLLVLVVHLRAQNVEPRTDAGVMRGRGLVQRELAGGQLGVHRGDARGVGQAEQVGVAHGEYHHLSRVFGGELRRGKVVPGGDVALQRRDVDEALREVGAEVFHLKRTDDGIKAGELEAEGGQVDLLHLDGCVARHGGKQRLELLHLLAVRALLRGGLQDEPEVLAQAARDGVVQREVEHSVRRFARDQ
jgi:hypothetical protein